jgi:hypothetical protein
VNSRKFRRRRSSFRQSRHMAWCFFSSVFFSTYVCTFSSTHVHAAFGGGGPRWQPLNVAGRHGPMVRCQSESVLAGRMVTAVPNCGWTVAVFARRLGGAGGGGGGGEPRLLNGDGSKLCYLIIGLLMFSYTVRRNSAIFVAFPLIFRTFGLYLLDLKLFNS